jgi:Mitochondrial mRNA-processing protein COX24, C-terminal
VLPIPWAFEVGVAGGVRTDRAARAGPPTAGWWRSRAQLVLAPAESRFVVGSVIKKRRKRMAKKKHRKLLKRTRVQRRNKK